MVRVALSLTIVIGLSVLAGYSPAAQPADRIVIDMVAVDGEGRPVEGLTKDDFRVRESGSPVAIDSVQEVGSNTRAAQRTVVLLLDDSGVPPQLTSTVQRIARSAVTRATPGDRVSVLRLNRRDDEATGGQALALSRIGDYTAGLTPFFDRETIENVLRRVSALSRQFERDPGEPRRRTILAIGAPSIFDVREPARESNLVRPAWADALIESSRALVNVSVIDPEGVTGRVKLIGRRGLVERTGGESLYNSGAFDAAVERVWRDAGHYYLLEYTSPRTNGEAHAIDVRAVRGDVHVRARKVRG